MRLGACRGVFVAALILAQGAESSAQIVPSDPPGVQDRGSAILGPSPGAGSGALGDVPGENSTLLMSRPGRSGPRVPLSIPQPSLGPIQSAPAGIRLPEPLAGRRRPQQAAGTLDLDLVPENEGPVDGLTLDLAIERLIANNLELRTQYFEIPQAEADQLTAGLRANPLIYADATAVPYGNYSPRRPGGQTQYDVSITYPLDVTGKRKARMKVAAKAKRVLEAQYQDAVRLQIDNLYGVFVDFLAAREALAFAKINVNGLKEIEKSTRSLVDAGERQLSELQLVQVRLDEGELSVRDAESNLARVRQTLGLLLNIPLEEVATLEVRGAVRMMEPEPPPDDQLVALAIESRPDVQAYRLGITRAEADVALARANRLSDVYLLYGPYVFQNNAPFGTKSAHSWSVALTVPLPVYNRNQGNIQRARLNVAQTASGLASLERKVASEVMQADQEYDVTRSAVKAMEATLLPKAKEIRTQALTRYRGGESSALELLESLRAYTESVRQYRDYLVRHRRAMLELNTALGRRVLP